MEFRWRRFGGRLLLIAAVATIAGYLLLRFATGPIVSSIYANVLPVAEREMPVTAGAVEPTSDGTLTLGGRGEGLSCSVPGFMAAAFDHQPTALRFRQACAYHDYCYRHGAATFNYTQADCDRLLQEHSFRICHFIMKAGDIEYCQDAARKVLLGVRLGGAGSFRPSPRGPGTRSAEFHSTFFEFDLYPEVLEDYVVARVAPIPVQSRSEGLLSRGLYYFVVKPSGISVSVIAFRNDATVVRLPGFEIPGSPSWKVSAPALHGGRFVWWRRASMRNTDGSAYFLDPSTATQAEWRAVFFASGVTCRRRECDIESNTVHADPSDESGSALVALSTHSCKGGKLHEPCFVRVRANATPPDVLPIVMSQFTDRYRNFVTPPVLARMQGGLQLYFTRRDDSDAFDYADGLRLFRVDIPDGGSSGTRLDPQVYEFPRLGEFHEPAALLSGPEPYFVTFVRDPSRPAGRASLAVRGSNGSAGDRLLQCDGLDGAWLDLPAVFLNPERSSAVLRKASMACSAADACLAKYELRQYQVSPSECSLVRASPQIEVPVPRLLTAGSSMTERLSRLMLGQSIVTDLDGDSRLDFVMTQKFSAPRTFVRMNVFDE